MKIHLANYYYNAHIIYKDMFINHPKGIQYKPIISYGSILKKKLLGMRFTPIAIRKNQEVKLIHSCGQILNTENPWIASLEHFIVFSESNHQLLKNKKYYQELSQIIQNDSCKKILALTKIASVRIKEYFGNKNDINKKIDFCYPSIRFKSPELQRKKLHNPITLLFVANSDFILKGGREVIEVFYKLISKYKDQIQLIFKCPNVPSAFLNKLKNKNVIFINKYIEREELENLYKMSDIFIFPLFSSSFGVYLEAMNYGLPIITTNVFDVPEIVKHYHNGFIAKTKYSLLDNKNLSKFKNINEFRNYIINSPMDDLLVEEIVEYIEKLINDENLFFKISQNNINETMRNGRFSYIERNKKLFKIYSQYIS